MLLRNPPDDNSSRFGKRAEFCRYTSIPSCFDDRVLLFHRSVCASTSKSQLTKPKNWPTSTITKIQNTEEIKNGKSLI